MGLLVWRLASWTFAAAAAKDGFQHSSRDAFYSQDQMRKNAAQYQEYLADCEWSEAPATERLKGYFYQRAHDQYATWDDTPPGAARSQAVRECVIRDKLDKDSFWTIQRVGPFHSRGGDQTHFVSWEDPGHINETLKAEGKLCLTGYVARAIDENDDPVPYPPIHMHHAHLNPWVNPYLWIRSLTPTNWFRAGLAIMWLNLRRPIDAIVSGAHVIADMRIDQMHGDMQCHDDAGGMNCTIHRLPTSYGTCFTRSFYTDAMLQDERAPNSPVLTVWYETAIRISKRVEKHISPLVRYTNSPAEACREFLGFLPDPFVTYRVPTDKFSYLAHTVEMEGSGRLEELNVVTSHLHRKIALEHWVIIGEKVTLQALGLQYMPHPAPLDMPSHPMPGSRTLDDVRESIMKGVDDLRRQGLTINLCIDSGPMVEHVKADAPARAKSVPGIRDGEYDRYSGLFCDSPTIRVPAPSPTPVLITQVAFHRPNPKFKGWFPMHAAIFVQGLPGEDVPVDRPQWVSEQSDLTYDDITASAIKGSVFFGVVTLASLACCVTACCKARARIGRCRRRSRETKPYQSIHAAKPADPTPACAGDAP